MNPRIRELALQAEDYFYTEYYFHTEYDKKRTGYTREDIFMSKFAELIVKECVLISRTSTDGFSAGRRMEEHFGVEE